MLEEKLLTNKYGLTDSIFYSIIKVVETYLAKVNDLEEFDKKSSAEIISFLGVTGELIQVLPDKDIWIKRVAELIKELKIRIRQREIDTIALHEGITNIGVFLSMVSNETSLYQGDLDSINKLICRVVVFQCKRFIEEGNVRTSDFDVIYGMSGVGNYLLQYRNDKEVREALESICEYLIWIVSFDHNEKIRLPGWYISLENEPLYDCYSQYEDGYINYSMSHGCGGILLFLTNAYERGIVADGQKEAVTKITEEYLHINNLSNGLWWSGIISRKNYESMHFPNATPRQSWCYGNVSVLFALYRTAKLFSWNSLEILFMDELKKIAIMPAEQYYLFSPIICHGYAGTMTIFRILYEETKEEAFFKCMNHLLINVLEVFESETVYGFKNKKFPDSVEEIREDDNTFLNGAAGIVMELTAWIKKNSCFETMLLLKS